jgi:hypothetical protein
MSVVAGKINLSKEMENKMEKLEVKNINSIWQLISALENKEGIASEQPCFNKTPARKHLLNL